MVDAVASGHSTQHFIYNRSTTNTSQSHLILNPSAVSLPMKRRFSGKLSDIANHELTTVVKRFLSRVATHTSRPRVQCSHGYTLGFAGNGFVHTLSPAHASRIGHGLDRTEARPRGPSAAITHTYIPVKMSHGSVFESALWRSLACCIFSLSISMYLR